MTDPVTDHDQAEREAEEREDEQRREQYWSEAEQAAVSWLCGDRSIGDAIELLNVIDDPQFERMPYSDLARTLRAFAADEGVSNLLRLIARALDAVEKPR